MAAGSIDSPFGCCKTLVTRFACKAAMVDAWDAEKVCFSAITVCQQNQSIQKHPVDPQTGDNAVLTMSLIDGNKQTGENITRSCWVLPEAVSMSPGDLRWPGGGINLKPHQS